MKRTGSLPVFLALAIIFVVTLVEATPLAPNQDNPDLVLEGPGLTLAAGGVGLKTLGGGTETPKSRATP